jgi:O-antigen ligase
MAALFFGLPLGFLGLSVLIRRRDAAAIVVALAIGWCVLVSLFHTSPGLRLFGMIGLESSVLIYVGAAACWAIGRLLDERGRSILPWAVIGATAVSAVFGMLQVVLQVDSGALVLDDNRAHGLATYSIYFGSLASMALVLLAALDLPRRLWPWQLIGVLVFAIASGLSGSRAALGAAVLGTAYLVYRRRDAVAGLTAGLILAGNVLASWTVDQFNRRNVDVDVRDPSVGGGTTSAVGDGGSSLQRLGGSGGLSWRIDMWKVGFDAWLDRPIIGWGVGNFRQAIQADVSVGFEQAAPRFDAHNFVVELLTTIGLPGLVLFATFAVLCARQARGPLALAATTLAWSWMLQPAGLSTLPLALLLLGAAMPALRSARPAERDTRRLVDGAAALGLVALVTFSMVDLAYSRAVDVADPEAFEAIEIAYPFDPTFADAAAQAWMFEIRDRALDPQSADADIDEAVDKVLLWSQRAIDRQPDAPRWYDAYALRLAQLGRYEDASKLLNEALDLQPRRVETTRLLEQIESLEASSSDS